jgi:hypothetical protein
MVKNKITILVILIICNNAINGFGQNSFLDEIQLMNQQRNIQLVDSSKNIEHAFLIRSTQQFQSIQLGLYSNRRKKIIQNFYFGYDHVNNSLLPQNWNDGNMYPARGWQERYSVGLQLKLGILDINLQPEWLKVQNLPQQYYPGNPEDGNFMPKYFGSVANVIDNYRQFGSSKIDTFSLGQSRVGLKLGPISVGYSNQNNWWGPGKRNSIVFTNNAAGFKHLYFSSNKPILSPIGNIEFAAITGILDTNWYQDPDIPLMRSIWSGGIAKKNLDQRKIDAITINWRPKWIPNLFLGYAYSRQYYKHQTNSYGLNYSFFSKDFTKVALGSLMFRFLLPKDNAEFYGELGLPNRAAWPWKFFEKNPKTGFIFGVTKIAKLRNKNSYLSLNVEMTQFQLYNPKDMFYPRYAFVGGLPNSWYTNEKIKQGYTNQGQILGAAIGPGSNSQTINLSYHYKYNHIGMMVERISQNNDFFSVVYFSGKNGQLLPGIGQVWGYYNKYWVDINSKIYAQIMPIKNIIIAASWMQTDAMNYRWLKFPDPRKKYDEGASQTDKYNLQFQVSLKYLINAKIQ